MESVGSSAGRLFRRTPLRTFILFPLITLAWELILNRASLRVEPLFFLLMLWGYLQYRWCGQYRMRHGGGGPGFDNPPEGLVTSGPYAYARNPMYLGHILFLIGLTLTLRSLFAAFLTAGSALWFHSRVLTDERRLAEQFGEPYLDYCVSVKRWIPGLF